MKEIMNKNYQLIEKRHVADVEGYVYLWEHIKSGAKVLKIANSDSNKTFCISFGTEPDDDSGIPHILEHSVLNGSKKYPVKSPFDQMYKGSLNTFLNAMTGSEKTMFPVASISNKDYFNLMDVYLDAVFNPRIYDDPRILKQEGWRIEAKTTRSKFKYTGVVYNEMKGNYSDPLSLLITMINKNLFPDNGYGRVAGGYPPAIPTLTQEHFTEYHKKHYHPENSYVYFYGDADMEEELLRLDEEYLCKYSRANGNYDIPDQKPFSEPKTITEYYSSDNQAETGSYLALNYVTCANTDTKHLLALDIIGDVLVRHESGAIRTAFKEAQIGWDISVYNSLSRQNVFSILGMNANNSKAGLFREIVSEKLREAANGGFDKQTVQAVINRHEFELREGNDAQKGLKKLFEVINPWMAGKNPIDMLETTKIFDQLKTDIENGLLEETVRKYLIDNPHSLLAVMEPKPGLEKEMEARTQAELDEIRKSMTKQQIKALVDENRELALIQNTPDSPEALKCIPTLEKGDLNTKAEFFPVEVMNTDGTETIYYESPTHGIVYMKYIFNMKTLPEELIPYGSLISELMGLVSTKRHTYGELDNIIKNYTGRCYVCNEIHSITRNNQRQALVDFVIGGKCLIQNTGKMMEIMLEIANESILSDKARLKELISQLDSEQDNDLNGNIYQYMRNRIESYYNPACAIDEYISGIDFLRFVKDLNKNFDTKANEIIANLQKTMDLIIRRDNVKIFVQCEKENIAGVQRLAAAFVSQLNGNKSTYLQWNIKPEPKNEGFIIPTQVQYVLKAYDCLSADYKWKGGALVLSKILSSDYLQNSVRVCGGAYGAWSSFSNDGFICMGSYRDPNLTETLDIYNKASEYVENFNEPDDELLKYIIGTIAGKDKPLTISQKGNLAYNRYLAGRTENEVQTERDEIINASAADIRQYAGVLAQMRDNGSICVCGSETVINKNSKLFNNIITL